MVNAAGRDGPVRAAVVIIAVLSAGCGVLPDSAPAGEALPAPLMRHVLLPDISGASAGVQERIGRAYAQLEDARAARASDNALATRYGGIGNLFLATGYFASAITAYDNARLLAPLESRWAYYLGHGYRHQGDVQAAMVAFNRALQMDPDYPPARVWLAETSLHAGRPELARLAFTSALSLQPNLSAALFGMGRTALEQRDYAAAADYLTRALAQDADAAAIHYPLAMAYRGMGDMTRAEAHLRQRGNELPEISDPWMDAIARLLREMQQASR